MGFNTPVLILNDAMENLRTDPLVGTKLYNAIMHSTSPKYRDRGVDFSIGNHCNGGLVLPSKHADETQVIAVGGNYMRSVYSGYYLDMMDSVKICKAVADSLGYRLVKKSEK